MVTMFPCVLDYSRGWKAYQAPSVLLQAHPSLIATHVNCLWAQSCPASSSPVVTLLYSSSDHGQCCFQEWKMRKQLLKFETSAPYFPRHLSHQQIRAVAIWWNSELSLLNHFWNHLIIMNGHCTDDMTHDHTKDCLWTEHVQNRLRTQSIEQKRRRIRCEPSRSCGMEGEDATRMYACHRLKFTTPESPYAWNTWKVAFGAKKISCDAGPHSATNNFKLDTQT